MPIKSFTPNRHFQLIERILRHIIRIQFVHLPNDDIDVWLVWFREQEKLRTSKCLEASQAEVGRFEDFDACSLVGWNAERGRGERFGDGVDTEAGQFRSDRGLAVWHGIDHTHEMCLQALEGR